MKLSTKPGKGEKIHIFVDDEYRLTVDSRFWYSERWHNQTQIDSGELAALEEAVGSRRAFNSAEDYLSRRDHSEKELYEKLCRKYPPAAAETAIEKAKDLGLLDDERFAANYAAELYEKKHFASRRILLELRRKGIDREIAENAVGGLDKVGETRIIELLRGKYRAAFSDEKSRRRAVNGLLRMGYAYTEIRAALETLEQEFEELDTDG